MLTPSKHIKSIDANKNTIALACSPGVQLIEKGDGLTLNRVDTTMLFQCVDGGKTDDEYWLGNRDGLFYKDKESISSYPSEKSIFKKQIIKLIYDRHTDQLTVATKDTGIYLLKENKLSVFTKEEGLSGNNITALHVHDNRIWVASTEGMDQIIFTDDDSNGFKIRNYNKAIVSNIITDIEEIDSVVYVSTDKGISFFNYHKVKKNTIPPPLILKKISINNQDTLYQTHYKLGNKENNIRIDFEAISFKAPKDITYSYILKGFHTEWQTTDSETIEFMLLPPGNYQFYLYALNEDGVHSHKVIMFNFTIRPPFHLTWWFVSTVILLIILVSASFLTVVYRVRIKEIKKRNRVEKELIQERQKALGQQMNPHFIFNTLNSIQYYLYKNDKYRSMDYLQKFGQLMRNTLYNSQKDFISIEDEINSLTTYLELEQLRLDHTFDFSIGTDKSIDPKSIMIPCFLVQPFAENSVWHGIQHLERQGKLTIDFSMNGEYIICTIEDNGVGREHSMEINNKSRKSHKSLGSIITENRIELINNLYKKNLKAEYIDKYDDKGTACGTTVKLYIPVF
jgi:hypothetical protein